MNPIRQTAPFLVLGLVACLFSGCVSLTPAAPEPAVALPQTIGPGGDAALPTQWWTAFDDPALNDLIETALAENPSLRVAWARLDQAAALRDRAGAERLPSLNASAGAERKVSKDGGAPREYENSYRLGLASSWEVDLWGRIRASQAAAAQTEAARAADLQATALMLTGSIATAWYDWLGIQAQLELIDQQLEVNENFLEVITTRFKQGQAPVTDVLQQRQLLASTRADRIQLETSARLRAHQLAVLLGQAPGTLDLPEPNALPDAPALPDAGLPAEWVRRRPDLRAAWADVLGAGEDIGVARADRLPTLDLSIRGSSTAMQTHDLLRDWTAGVAAGLAAPLLDGGRRRAEVARTLAAQREALANYESDLLDALREVADATIRISDQQRFLAALDEQLALSRQAADQVRNAYRQGAGDFTRYLSSLTSHQRLQRSRVQAHSNLLQYHVALGRALGGGWELTPPPSSDDNGGSLNDN